VSPHFPWWTKPATRIRIDDERVDGSLAVHIFNPLQRETTVLNRYIALKVRQDVLADDTELHIEPEEAFRDLFDIAQPQAKLEDLVRIYGIREGVITVLGIPRTRSTSLETSTSKYSSVTSLQTVPSPSSILPPMPSPLTPQLQPSKPLQSLFSFTKKSSSPVSPQTAPATRRPPIQPLPFSLITVSFSPRKVGVIYNRSRTIAEVRRALSPAERRFETLETLARALVRRLMRSSSDLAFTLFLYVQFHQR
jgi:hypothetical protein